MFFVLLFLVRFVRIRWHGWNCEPPRAQAGTLKSSAGSAGSLDREDTRTHWQTILDNGVSGETHRLRRCKTSSIGLTAVALCCPRAGRFNPTFGLRLLGGAVAVDMHGSGTKHATPQHKNVAMVQHGGASSSALLRFYAGFSVAHNYPAVQGGNKPGAYT